MEPTEVKPEAGSGVDQCDPTILNQRLVKLEKEFFNAQRMIFHLLSHTHRADGKIVVPLDTL